MQHGLSFPVQDAAEAFTAWLERLGHFLPASGFRASPEKSRRAGAGGAESWPAEGGHHLQRASQGSGVQRGNGNDDDFKENKHLKNHPWTLSCSTKPKPNDCHSGPIFAAGTLEALDSPSHMHQSDDDPTFCGTGRGELALGALSCGQLTAPPRLGLFFHWSMSSESCRKSSLRKVRQAWKL